MSRRDIAVGTVCCAVGVALGLAAGLNLTGDRGALSVADREYCEEVRARHQRETFDHLLAEIRKGLG